MKQLPAILFIAAAAILLAPSPAQAAPILDFAVRVGCDFQQPEKGLMDLHVLQGSTPLVLAMPKAGNTALTPDADTSVRMVIGPSETGSIYAVRTNYAIAGGGYAIDWPTIGTNSSGQAWFYTLLFDREGKTYWSGSGALYIDASTYTGPDGVDWIEYTTPNVGWTNLSITGTGNAITGATAAADTLTLQRGEIESGGSGFPLTNDVSAAGYNVEQVGLLSASSVRAATDVYATNDVSARDLYARRNLDVAGNGTIDGDLVVSGNFTLIGSATNLNWVVVDNRTNVYSGTNYYEIDTYRTSIVYQQTVIYTNIITTNNINTYVNENGTWVATNAEYALLPHLRDYRDGKAYAVGAWDFSAATLIGLPAQGVTNIGSSMTGNGLETALDVDWGTATTTAMTNIDWASFGDGGATNMANGTYDAGTRTLTATGYPTIAEMEAYVARNAVSATNEIPADLDDLADVATATAANGEYLFYTNGTWTNKALVVASAASMVITQMPYLAQALVTGTVVGVYDNANVGFTETLLFGNANSNSFVFEELNAGTVTGLTTLANSTTQGILSATTDGTKITNGCVLRIGGASYGIQALTGGTNVTFLPALNSNTSYAVDSVRGISHTSVALHQGAAGTTNGPFVDLVAGNKGWDGISVAPNGTTIYATVWDGSIWKSTDAGATWVDLAAGKKDWRGISVAPDGTTIYAAVNYGSIWKSVDAGATWVALPSGDKSWRGISVAPDGTTIYATVWDGSIWKSVDAGATWVDLVAGTKNWIGISVAPDGTTIYATAYNGSIWKSTNSGATWVALPSGNKTWTGISVAPDGTTIYATVYVGSIWKSVDAGATWVDLATGNKYWQGISVAPDGTTIYATVRDGSIWRSEWSAYAPVLGVGHTVATIPMATTTNWRYFNDLYFRDNSNFTGTFYSISWQTNCWSIWSTNSSSWRVVASNDSGAWKWNSNGTFVAQAGLTNNELGTLSYAVQTSVSNRMSRADIDGLNDGTYKSAGGFLAGYSPRTAVTFLNQTTNLPPRVYERRVLVDDLRYEQKQANTNDYNLYIPGTNSALTIVTKKVARTCDVVIKYLKDQP